MLIDDFCFSFSHFLFLSILFLLLLASCRSPLMIFIPPYLPQAPNIFNS